MMLSSLHQLMEAAFLVHKPVYRLLDAPVPVIPVMISGSLFILKFNPFFLKECFEFQIVFINVILGAAHHIKLRQTCPFCQYLLYVPADIKDGPCTCIRFAGDPPEREIIPVIIDEFLGVGCTVHEAGFCESAAFLESELYSAEAAHGMAGYEIIHTFF